MAKAASSIMVLSRSPQSVKGQAAFSALDKSRSFFMALISSLIALAILGAIFYIGLRVKVVNLGYRINQEIQNKERIIEENKRLNLEIASLKSPTRIEAEAKEKLGLALPQPHQIIYLNKGGSAEAMDFALSKIKPIPQAPAIVTPVSPVPKVALPSQPKRSEPAPRTKPVSEKPAAAPKILIAKIVGKKPPDDRSRAKLASTKPSPSARESVPAIMLDSMP